MNATPYTSEFFDGIRDMSLRSARVIAPIVIELTQPKSIVDIGCGDGTWLSVFKKLGINDVLGIDGEYVDRHSLKIPQEQFVPADLSVPLRISRTFDLAISLEVGEHLPAESAKGFVESLTNLAPLILFSAAIPGQGGGCRANHINEQWPNYWAALFKEHSYLPIDCIRGEVWDNEQVEWFYAQNILLFIRTDLFGKRPDLEKMSQQTNQKQLALVHPQRFIQPVYPSNRRLLRLLKRAIINKFKVLVLRQDPKKVGCEDVGSWKRYRTNGDS